MIQRLLDEEQYRRLQIALMLRPEQGPVIRGAGGLRILYFWAPAETAFYMLYAYAKNEQGDLMPAQVRVLGRLVREELQ